MKRAIVPILLSSIALGAVAQELPAPSPLGMVKQRVGLTDVTVEYSRPNAKGRQIFGDLVPFDQLWRTGANNSTSIEFSSNVKIEGTEVPAGKYYVITMPSESGWQVMLNTNSEISGTDGYNPEQNVAHIKVQPSKCEFVETLTFTFQDVKDDKARLDLAWENTRVSIWIQADCTDQAVANIKEALAKPDVSYNGYSRSARFCVDRGIMLSDALGWATKSVEMEKKYWNTHTLALAQAANGLYREAIATAEMSMQLAVEAKADGAVKDNKARIEEWKMKAQ